MKILFHCLLLVLVLSCNISSGIQQKGEPWHNEMQQIPGRIEFEYYDEGGEGVAYHDSDAVNNGSGKLNPTNGTYLNEFRMKEGVDISYTKAGNIEECFSCRATFADKYYKELLEKNLVECI